MSKGENDVVSTENTDLARWCRQLQGGEYQCDPAKINNLLSNQALGCSPSLGGFLRGDALTGKIWPLLFDRPSSNSPDFVRLRSSEFFIHLLEDGGTDRFQAMSHTKQHTVAVGVRDLFLASWQGNLSDEENVLLNDMTQMMSQPVADFSIQGMEISFHPCANFRMLRFITNLDAFIEQKWEPYFVQVMNEPRLFAVFVDPTELSYHNFENIVPLDEWVDTTLAASGTQTSLLDFKLDRLRRIKNGRDIWTCNLSGDGSQLLQKVPLLDLYVPPLNKATRGGERFIFHSNILSKAIGQAIREGRVLDKIMGAKKASKFAFVNPVFRCNKFSPHTGKFSSHRDTPYYDAARNHISRYSLLVYLTSGHGKPILRVGDIELNSITEMTCVMFDQKLEHEGRPYDDAEKLFLRTELVFEQEKLIHSSDVAALFSEACYMTGHSIYDDEIARHAHACYEKANSLHWGLNTNSDITRLYLHKTFDRLSFVTTGYNYWFTKDNHIDIKDCAAIALLDYFNCKIDGKPFRALSNSKVLQQTFESDNDIWAYLAKRPGKSNYGLKKLEPSDFDELVTTEPSKPFVRRETPEWLESYEDEEDDAGCCPFHAWMTFDAWESEHVREVYDTCCAFTRRKVFGEPLMLLGKKIIINESQIHIKGDKISFLCEKSGKQIPPINFAACWRDESVDAGYFIGVDQELGIPKLLVPPIQFQELDHGYRLTLDFFRNDWMIQVDMDRKIPVPIITNEIDLDTFDDGDCKPFLSKVNSLQGYHVGDDMEIESWASEPDLNNRENDTDTETEFGDETVSSQNDAPEGW
jgi:hypothetical protein